MTAIRAGTAGPPVDPFGGYFARNSSAGEPHGVVDLASARSWFDYLRWGFEEDLYTYQQPVQHRTGTRVTVAGREMLMMSSYDYLGLIGHPTVNAAARLAVREHGTGAGGVRMLTGTHELHLKLERDIARFKDTGAVLTFTSGYLANIAAVTGLVGPKDRVLLDANAHRSLVDGCCLARVPVSRFAHNDLASVETLLEQSAGDGRTLVITEGVFSMDGDLCPLPELIELKKRFDSYLLVDEAHSFGVLGATGRGINQHFGLPADGVDVWTGSLSKAIPANGGFIAGSCALVYYLQHVAAPFWFSAALCPADAAAASAALAVIREEPHRLSGAHRNAEALRAGLQHLGYDTGASQTCIVPVILGDDEVAYRAARQLYAWGILVSAVVAPAVPRGAARLRLCVTAAHSDKDLDETLAAFKSLLSHPDVARVCA